jgi:hypothetical protein
VYPLLNGGVYITVLSIQSAAATFEIRSGDTLTSFNYGLKYHLSANATPSKRRSSAS